MCWKVYTYQAALTNYDGLLDLYVPISDGIPMVASANQEFRKNTQRIPVQAIQLDSFVRDYEITRVDLIKIDTETTEAQVLQGAWQTIQRFRPIIFCEVLRYTDVTHLNHFFAGQRYRFCLLTDQGAALKSTIQNHPKFWNYLFIPEEVGENYPLLNHW